MEFKITFIGHISFCLLSSGLRNRAIWQFVTDVLEAHTTSIFKVILLPTRLHGVITQKTKQNETLVPTHQTQVSYFSSVNLRYNPGFLLQGVRKGEKNCEDCQFPGREVLLVEDI
jgi:hypothetical protein